MKRVFFLLLAFAIQSARAQFASEPGNLQIQIGSGYTRDFPGLGGLGGFAEGKFSMAERWQGGIGLKYLNMQGYPRTQSVQEYTRAATIDFNLYYSLLDNEVSALRLGVGYAFSFYNIRRSYPDTQGSGIEKTTIWPSRDAKGRTSGISLMAEYEYYFSSGISLGARVASYKAYDRVMYFGPFVGISL